MQELRKWGPEKQTSPTNAHLRAHGQEKREREEVPDVNGVHAGGREGVIDPARLLPAQEVVEHGDGGEGGSGKAARSAPSPPFRDVIFPQQPSWTVK